MVDELEEFKTKVLSFQETIRRGMEDAVRAQPTHRTSVAAYCGLSEADREQHRQQAGNRRQELAENWDLSRITEASNASRARLSVDVNQSMFLSHLPEAADCGDQITTANDVICAAAGAAGDQAMAQSPIKLNSQTSSNLHSPLSVEHAAKTDELTDVKEVIKEKPVRKKAMKPRAKKVADRCEEGDAGEKKSSAAKPRQKKHAKQEEAVAAGDPGTATSLRPRRKGVNYTEK